MIRIAALYFSTLIFCNSEIELSENFSWQSNKLKKYPAPWLEWGILSAESSATLDSYYPTACSIATATATEAPTIGLFPIPIKPIISTWAGTEEEPANWASECILPMVSVMP